MAFRRARVCSWEGGGGQGVWEVVWEVRGAPAPSSMMYEASQSGDGPHPPAA